MQSSVDSQTQFLLDDIHYIYLQKNTTRIYSALQKFYLKMECDINHSL